MSKYIYFIEGHLTQDEKPYADKYFKKIRDIYKAEAKGYILKVSVWPKDYELARERACTKSRFEAIWEDPDTAGIILYSHGDQHGRTWLIGDIGESKTVMLDPRELSKSGSNLRGLTVLGCRSRVMERFWREKINHSRPAVSTVAGMLEDGSLDRNDETLNWIRRGGGSYTRPEVGSRSFLKYVMNQLDPVEHARGIRCNLAETDHVSAQRVQGRIIARQERFPRQQKLVRFQRIPTVGTEAGHFTMHKIRFDDRVRYLAEDYGYSDRGRFVADVERLNPGINFHKLQPGQNIRVPTKVGVPQRLSAPWASRAAHTQKFRQTVPVATGAARNTLQVLSKRLGQTAPTSPQPRPVGSSVTDTLKHLEMEAANREANDRWLERLRQQHRPKPIFESSANTHGQRPFLRTLGDRLQYRPPAAGTAGDLSGSTVDLIRGLEREAVSRDTSQKWLQRIGRQYGAPKPNTLADRGTALGRIGQYLDHTPSRTLANRATFSGGGDLSNPHQIHRFGGAFGGGEPWIRRAGRQLR